MEQTMTEPPMHVDALMVQQSRPPESCTTSNSTGVSSVPVLMPVARIVLAIILARVELKSVRELRPVKRLLAGVTDGAGHVEKGPVPQLDEISINIAWLGGADAVGAGSTLTEMD